MAELNVVGGHIALDLVNTVDPRTPARGPAREHLTSPGALLEWARRVDLLTAGEAAGVARAWRGATAGEQALRATIELREATYDVLLAHLGARADARVADAALDLVRDRWVEAMGRSALRLTGGRGPGRTDRLEIGTDPSVLVPDRLADAAVDVLRTLDVRQLKACPLDEGGCGFLFLDRSPGSTRRWCSMQDCGARAKARRLTARRRADRGATTES